MGILLDSRCLTLLFNALAVVSAVGLVPIKPEGMNFLAWGFLCEGPEHDYHSTRDPYIKFLYRVLWTIILRMRYYFISCERCSTANK